MSFASTAHDADRRAESSADPRLLAGQQLDLSDCASGLAHGGRWIAVRGPHLKKVYRRNKRSRTGVQGIGYYVGPAAPGRTTKYRYFVVSNGRQVRRFNITTLGKEEAWRRALKCRAEHELRIRAINETILSARKRAASPNH